MILNIKRNPIFFLLLSSFLFCLPQMAMSVGTPQKQKTEKSSKETFKKNNKTKLSFKEKILLALFKKKLKKKPPSKSKFNKKSVYSALAGVLSFLSLVGSIAASFTLSELGVIAFGILCLVFAIAAIFLGIKARREISKEKKKGKGLALLGIILGGVIGAVALFFTFMGLSN